MTPMIWFPEIIESIFGVKKIYIQAMLGKLKLPEDIVPKVTIKNWNKNSLDMYISGIKQ